MKWGTQKILKQIQEDPENLENMELLEVVIADLLRPKPSQKTMLNFRNSDIEKIFNEFGKEADGTNADLKKKLSQ